VVQPLQQIALRIANNNRRKKSTSVAAVGSVRNSTFHTEYGVGRDKGLLLTRALNLEAGWAATTCRRATRPLLVFVASHSDSGCSRY
jgi:hypothetical protein